MKHKLLLCTIVVIVSFMQYQCAPSLRSAKIQPGFSVDGVALGTVFTASATNEDGSEENTTTEFNNNVPLDVKFRYGWERKENFGFELTGGLDGQMGAYVEFPGSDAFHWGLGAETNLWVLSFAGSFDDNEDNIGKFLRDHNFNAYIMAGYMPSQKFELSVGVKYQPFLKSLIDAVPEDELNIDVGGTLPFSYLLDSRYMFSDHLGIMLGGEIFHLSASGQGSAEASMTGGYIYLGLTYR